MSNTPPPPPPAGNTADIVSPIVSPPSKRVKTSDDATEQATAGTIGAGDGGSSLPPLADDHTGGLSHLATTAADVHLPPPSSLLDPSGTGAVEASFLPDAISVPPLGIEMFPPLQIKKLAPSAKLPTRGSAFAAGYDLYASRDTTVPAKGKVLVDTDISMACPAGTYGRIAPRSGLASKHFIDTGAGVIDADYRGPVKVLLFNHAEADFPVKEGDRIAQLVLERIINPDVVEVAELEESVRGAGGFGSTGGFGDLTATGLGGMGGMGDGMPGMGEGAAVAGAMDLEGAAGTGGVGMDAGGAGAAAAASGGMAPAV